MARHLALLPEGSGQHSHSLRDAFSDLRDTVKTGAPWRWAASGLPPWEIVYQQAQRWHRAGCLEALTDNLRAVLRLAAGAAKRRPHRQPHLAIPAGERLGAGYDGAKRKKSSKLHSAGKWNCEPPGKGPSCFAIGTPKGVFSRQAAEVKLGAQYKVAPMISARPPMQGRIILKFICNITITTISLVTEIHSYFSLHS